MTVSRQAWQIMRAADRTPRSTADLRNFLAKRRPTDSLDGMAVFINARHGVRLALWCADPFTDTVCIPLPAGKTIKDLADALCFYPTPALIFAILYCGAIDGAHVVARGRRLIELCRGEFIEVISYGTAVQKCLSFQ